MSKRRKACVDDRSRKNSRSTAALLRGGSMARPIAHGDAARRDGGARRSKTARGGAQHLGISPAYRRVGACRATEARRRARRATGRRELWPHVSDASEAAWSSALAELEKSNRELRDAVLRLDDSRLDAPILAGMSSVYVTLHGIVQHTLYHAGQIALLKKG